MLHARSGSRAEEPPVYGDLLPGRAGAGSKHRQLCAARVVHKQLPGRRAVQRKNELVLSARFAHYEPVYLLSGRSISAAQRQLWLSVDGDAAVRWQLYAALSDGFDPDRHLLHELPHRADRHGGGCLLRAQPDSKQRLLLPFEFSSAGCLLYAEYKSEPRAG